MPVFFIEADRIRQGVVTIRGSLFTHLKGSLRVQVGEQIRFTDDRRRRYLVEITEMTRSELHGRVLEEHSAPVRSFPSITLLQAVLKGERMDWMIQKATELGADQIIPVVTRRTIVRPRLGRTFSQVDRWRRVAREAAQQAERWDVPTILEPRAYEAALADCPDRPIRLILTERTGGLSLNATPLPNADSPGLVLAVGPEGGWTPEEVQRALEEGFLTVTLGKVILRAETATLAALSILQSRMGTLG